jgi:hypothetical protein
VNANLGKNHWKNRSIVTEEQFPLDYIVQDWQYWGSDKDGTWSGS